MPVSDSFSLGIYTWVPRDQDNKSLTAYLGRRQLFALPPLKQKKHRSLSQPCWTAFQSVISRSRGLGGFQTRFRSQAWRAAGPAHTAWSHFLIFGQNFYLQLGCIQIGLNINKVELGVEWGSCSWSVRMGVFIGERTKDPQGGHCEVVRKQQRKSNERKTGMKGENRTPSFLQLVCVAPVQMCARAHGSLCGDRLNLENLAECGAGGRVLSLFSPSPWSPCVHAGARQRLL